MKIGLYSPFVADTLGGGERYLLTVAQCLLPKHEVDLVLAQNKDLSLQKLTDNFHLPVDGLKIIHGPFGPKSSAWKRWRFTRQYDVFYYLTDGSFFIPGAKRNIAHFMIPFNRRPGLIQGLKLSSWQIKTTHSYFCKEALERIWKIKIDFVHWGAVEANDFTAKLKQNLIVSVGRWFHPGSQLHCKRQDFLVKIFRKMCDAGLKGWRLVLIGPVDPGEANFNYLKQVRESAQGYPVEFLIDLKFSELAAAYGRAKIYWHAAGYGSDETANPQAMEHFGISTIEAMAAGAVPVVIKKGGQKEIVNHGINGLLWESQGQLIKYTRSLIEDDRLRQKLAKQAQTRAKDFSVAKFCQTTNKIFGL